MHTIDCDSEEDETNFPYFNEILKEAPKDISEDEFISYLQSTHSGEYINDVESKTRDQASNTEWFNHRNGRITASVMNNVVKCNMEKLKSDNYILRRIFNTNKCSFSTHATEYGKAMESVALSQYRLLYENKHEKFNISNCGFFISKEIPFIGATPDAVVSCSCCGDGLAEIKCSFSYQDKSPLEIATANDYHLYVNDGKVKLKESSPWYVQIQTQLYVTKRDWCDFVFFTRKGIAVDRISFNNAFFQHCLDRAKAFFFKFMKM